MPKADKITVSLEILVPTGTAGIVDGMSLDDLAQAVRSVSGRSSSMRVTSIATVESDEAAIEVAQLGNDFRVLRVVRPTHVTETPDHRDTVPVLQATAVPGGWRGYWHFGDGSPVPTPDVHPVREDAVEDARRRALASRDPEAEADEFDEQAHVDAFDLSIRYGVMLIDDENRWRGRWYRHEWTGEGAYTAMLYDTPGQARRAAHRLRATGDES